MKPYFVVVEGLDRVGKTTFAKQLHEDLNKLRSTKLLRDPDPSFKPAIMGTENKAIQLSIFAMSRTITSHENANTDSILLCDRWAPSSAFYQGASTPQLNQLSNIYGWLRPNLILFLTCSHEEWVSRWGQRTDAIETTEKQFVPMLEDEQAYKDATERYRANCYELIGTPKTHLDAVITLENYHSSWAEYIVNAERAYRNISEKVE